MTVHDIVLALLGSWVAASALKFLSSDRSLAEGFDNGGMPSSHSATSAALATILFIRDGVTLAFAVAVYLTFVIGSDAVNVRRTLELQTRRLNPLLEDAGHEPMPVVEGHTRVEVIGGVLLGIAVAILVGVGVGSSGIASG